MSKVKYFITETPKWPFEIKITDESGNEVCAFERAIVSSSWKNLEDVHIAYGWEDGTCNMSQVEARKKIKEQMDYIHLFAAAPDYDKAAKFAVEESSPLDASDLSKGVIIPLEAWEMLKAAIQKATGEE